MTMIRPVFEDISIDWSLVVAGGGTGCSCGAFIYSEEQQKAHWEAGHYDSPPPLEIAFIGIKHEQD